MIEQKPITSLVGKPPAAPNSIRKNIAIFVVLLAGWQVLTSALLYIQLRVNTNADFNASVAEFVSRNKYANLPVVYDSGGDGNDDNDDGGNDDDDDDGDDEDGDDDDDDDGDDEDGDDDDDDDDDEDNDGDDNDDDDEDKDDGSDSGDTDMFIPPPVDRVNWSPDWLQRVLGGSAIRSWGCHRTETPMIFVHIGKAGGGSARTRLAASALNYTRTGSRSWANPILDEHYYPVSPTHRGKFCNSRNRDAHSPSTVLFKVGTPFKPYEGTITCNATSPLGIAVACPEVFSSVRCLGCANVKSKHCHTVYVGHNTMGSEIHWLPPKYLQQWWKKNWERSGYGNHSEAVTQSLQTLTQGDEQWCFGKSARPTTMREQKKGYALCGLPLGSKVDKQFKRYWDKLPKPATHSSTVGTEYNFAPLYASLPVHRVVVIREPFSWLLSKFFWHHDFLSSKFKCTEFKGWAEVEILRDYLLKLCGVDCANRYESGLLSLEGVEAQTEANLRHSFSVVGLSEEPDVFYSMINMRMAYMNTKLNLHLKNSSHSSINKKNKERAAECKEIYAGETFRNKVRKDLPVLAAMERLYYVGVEVNRFQQEELSRCSAQ